MSSAISDYTPQELVDILQECGGDLQKFAKEIAPGDDIETVIMHAEFKLADHNKEYLRWCQLIQARNQARFITAQQKAFDLIGKYEIPKDKDGNDVIALSTMVSYMRFWLGAHSVGEQTKARKEASAITGSAEQRTLDELFQGLTEGG